MAEELLDQVIQLLEEPLAGVELRRAWGPGWASRLLEGPVASGEVLSHHREGDRQETVLRFSLFAPEAQERREAAAALEAAVVQLCPGCVEIDREEEREDSQTRLPCLSLRLVFAGGALGMVVKLGGKNYKAAGAVVSASQSGTELTSVGAVSYTHLIGWWPVRNTMAAMDECEYEYEAIYKVLKGEATAEDYNIPGSLYKNLYTDILSIPEAISEDYDPNEMLHVTDMDVNTNNGQFNRLTALLIGDRPFATEEPDKEVRSVLYYTIDVFDQYWTQLQDLEDQMVLSVMTGAQDISAFDTYVEQWNSMGGQEILAGIEEFLAEG